MDALQAIFTRRSIRQFKSDAVSEQDLETILRAAMSAPSAGNAQEWHFVCITDRATLARIPAIQPHSRMLLEAPLAILVCAEVGREKHEGFWPQDCAAATQNILLAAHALGLGACWMGLHPRVTWRDGIATLLGVPTGVLPLALVAIGHPKALKDPAERFDPARIHREHW